MAADRRVDAAGHALYRPDRLVERLARRGGAGTRLRLRSRASRGGTSRTGAGAVAHRSCRRPGSRASPASNLEGRRVAHRVGAAAPPRVSIGTGLPRARLRIPSGRGRTRRRAAARPRALASTSGNSMPVLLHASSRSRELGRRGHPLRRAGHPLSARRAEKYAVPHPSSTTSSPATSPRTQTSSSQHAEDPPPDSAVGPALAGGTPHPCTPRWSSSRPRGCERRSPATDEPIGEEQRQLAAGARLRVRPVDDVLGQLEREISANKFPGAEWSGFVAPIIVRTTEIADSPLTARASTGPDVMKSTSEPKKGFPRCSA